MLTSNVGKVASQPGTSFWLNQYNLSGFLNAGGQEIKQENIMGRAIPDLGPVRVPSGAYDHKADLAAMGDFLPGQIDEIIAAMTGTDADFYLAQAFGASVEGSIVYEKIVKLATRPITAASGQLVMITVGLDGAGVLSRSVILRNATVTGTGNGTGRNSGATLSGKTYQTVMRVISGTFTSITLAVQDSTDDAAGDPYVTITGLTNVFTVAGVARKTTTAATKGWKRLAVTAFTGTNALIVVTGGAVLEP